MSSESYQSEKPAFVWPDDVFTPANAISVAGAIMSYRGAEQIDTGEGVAKVVIGRAADVIDGEVARRTHTSNFGAFLDAFLDKAVTAKILYELHKKGVAPKKVIGTIAALSTVNFIATGAAMHNKPGQPIRPTKSGKIAMAGETTSLFLHATAHVVENKNRQHTAEKLRRLGNAAFVASLPFALHATFNYIKRAREK